MGAPGPRAVARLRAWPFAPHTASTAPRPPRGRTGQDGAVTPAVPAHAQQTLVGGQRQDGRGGGDGRGCLCHPARGRGAGSGRPPGAGGRTQAQSPSLAAPAKHRVPVLTPSVQTPHRQGPESRAAQEAPPLGARPLPGPSQSVSRGTACPPRPAMRKWAPGRGFSWAAASGRGRGRALGLRLGRRPPRGRPLSRATPSCCAPSSGEAGVITLLQDEEVEADRGQTVGSPGLTPEPGPGLAPHLPLGRPLPLRHPRRPWLGPTRPPGCSSGSQPVELSCLPWGGSGAQRAPQEAWGHPTLSPAGGPREALSLSLPLRPAPG